ncbi:hypothetical protein GCM10010232_35140 [Streptomyces amakusaensis]|uniref:Uncharacterized protein n=1 Tax=Streptomyces amakusaensis TaxID=67271 RepID=A0ABW0AG01_9ACTN
MSGETSGQDERDGGGQDPGTGANPVGTDTAGAEPPGGIVIGEFAGGAVAAGRQATAEDSGRTLGTRDTRTQSPAVVAPLPGGISIGLMTGGAAASGPGARATDRSEQFIEATPQLMEALALLRGETGELREEAALAEQEVRTDGRVEQGRLRRIASLSGVAAAAVAGQTAAGVAAETIMGMLA